MTTRHNITMEDVVGTKVLIVLHRPAFEAMQGVQGIESEKFVAQVVGLDGFRLWIENPQYRTTPVYTDDGEYIPPEDRQEVVHRAAVLLQWGAIQTVLQFPDRPAFSGGEDEVEIGFKAMVHRHDEGKAKDKQDG